MKARIWFLQLPFIIFFTLCFWISELGVDGDLHNQFLREKIFPPLSSPVHQLTDLKFKSRGPRPFSNKIVVVEIDSSALEVLGRWPWHRDITAQLIEKIFEAGAKVVGLDMIFSEPDLRVPPELAEQLKAKNTGIVPEQFETDHLLEQVIARRTGQLVLGWTTEQTCQPLYEGAEGCPVEDPKALELYPPEYQKFAVSEFIAPGFKPSVTPLISFITPIANIAPYSKAASHAGYLNAFLDSDGYIRRSSLIAMAAGKPYPSLPLEMARVGRGENLKVVMTPNQTVASLHLGQQPLAVTPLGVLQVNFRGGSQGFPHIPALEVLSDKDTIEDPLHQLLTGKSKKELLKDAYVLIGVSALGVFDMRQFPFESNAPGVDGHANILDNLLSSDPLASDHNGYGTLAIYALMVVGMIGFGVTIAALEAIPALFLFVLIALTSWFVDFKILFGRNINLNTSYFYLELSCVFVFTLAAKYVLEEQNKKFLRSAFSKYVSSTVVDSILKDPSKLSLGGEKREMSILFSDIRGFTTFSEKMDAKALASFLNDYLGIMTGIVFANNGTLDKYIGDAVMAFWGAPLPQADHAARACKAAIEMQEALNKHRERFKNQYGVDVHVGVGVNSGVVNVGNMGSEQNFEYTVIGDHVNLASRIEGLTKEYGVGAITSRYTFDSIKQSGLTPPQHRSLDHVKVKGKKQAVELIELISDPAEAAALAQTEKLFHEGRALYTAQKWDEAIKIFRKNSEGKTTPDGPSEVFIERCEFFKKSPPGADWDGSWEMHTK